MSSRRAFVAVLIWPLLAGCGFGPSGPGGPSDPLPDASVRALFVGNSLTYTNSLPELVRLVAEADGETFASRTVAFPNVSLEDHWIDGRALTEIDRAEWDVVVLQQGPSSLPQNRAHLREWSGRFAERIRTVGAEPALFMVWPSRSRSDAFDAVSASYAAAAEAVDGVLLPGGEAWRAAWRRDPDLELYGPDGFHPNQRGSLLVALVIYRVLYDRSVLDLPIRLEPSSPELPTIELDPEEAEILYAAAEEAVLAGTSPQGEEAR